MGVSRAYCLIRSEPHYRRDAFMAGLKAAGYDARTGGPSGVNPGDVVVMWNRYNENHELAKRVERQGGVVLVAENGYVKGRHDGGAYYALAIGGHNGSGAWPVGGPERWDALGVDPKPWRTEGDHILVCPNRSFGRPDLIMPYRWADEARARLARVTKRPVRIRPHPGNAAPKVPLEDDLRGAWAVVVWSSSVGVRALIEGVPVICEAPYWICKGAAYPPRWHEIEAMTADAAADASRKMQLRALAWAQWNTTEITTGEPFRYLLSDSRQSEGAAAL